MPTPESYKTFTDDELRERLALAEAACILGGWTARGVGPNSGSDAATQAWMEWADVVGTDYLGPHAHPDLNERRIHELASDRRRIREQTLRRIDESGALDA